MIIDAGYCFWLGVSFGFGVGALFVKLVQHATGPRKPKVGTPSASHNSRKPPCRHRNSQWNSSGTALWCFDCNKRVDHLY